MSEKEAIKSLLWKELLGYVHEGHVNGFEKAIEKVAQKLTASNVNDIDVVEMPYSPEYVAKLRDALKYIDNKAYILQREAMPARVLYEVEKIKRTAEGVLK